MKRIIRTMLVVGALICAGVCIFTSFYHEADEETLEFTSEPGEITSNSLSYYMIFTGERADKVVWDFGDGTSAEAFEVFKTYEKPGDYYVLCQSSNDHGVRYSAYSLHITESDYGIFAGYGLQIALMFASVFLMVGATYFRGD